ncbi:hypothetical protein Ae356Ps1_3489 [Pseudonocardia sp. Ae356_Ps1]|nr:hypothetical protein Ae356Ps1_3489 [Pseudonocardia sp. Ae356_Ps1]
MGVDRHGHVDVGVPGDGLHHVRRRPERQQQTDDGVPQVVQPNYRKAGADTELVEVAFQRARFDRSAGSPFPTEYSGVLTRTSLATLRRTSSAAPEAGARPTRSWPGCGRSAYASPIRADVGSAEPVEALLAEAIRQRTDAMPSTRQIDAHLHDPTSADSPSSPFCLRARSGL